MHHWIMTENLPSLGPDQLDEDTAAITALAVMEQGGTCDPLALNVYPYSAFVLVALIQLAWRYPDLTEAQRMTAEEIGRMIQGCFDEDIAAIIEKGWNTDLDQDVPR